MGVGCSQPGGSSGSHTPPEVHPAGGRGKAYRVQGDRGPQGTTTQQQRQQCGQATSKASGFTVSGGPA